MARPRWHTVNYRTNNDRAGRLFDRGFWLWNLPRLILRCRWFGHRPVVDGVGSADGRGYRSRWVVCDRCGIRPDPQGCLDPEQWSVGQRYDGPYRAELPSDPKQEVKSGAGEPGPWPAKPSGTVGGQLVVGKAFSTGVELKVGNGGSEHVLAGHISIAPLGALYLHTEQHGQGLQRRLNPTGHESRVIGFSAHNRRLYWNLWAKRDSWSTSDPRWQQGSFRIDPRDILLGEPRFSYEDVGEPVGAVVRMPHGDDHQVALQLQRRIHGRPRGLRVRQEWAVDWKCSPGIPTKPGEHGRITSSGVDVSAAAVTEGTWPAEACAAVAARITSHRTRYGYRPAQEPADA